MTENSRPRKDSIQEMGKALISSDGIFIYPHVHADGDAIGSASALCRSLRLMGKEAFIVVEDQVASNLVFMLDDMIIDIEDAKERLAELEETASVAVDGGEYSRFLKREEIFRMAKTSFCIDHHHTSKPIFDFNYMEDDSASCAELIYIILKNLGWKMDEKVLKSILAGIMTDTGDFVYSNTTSRSHQIAGQILDLGVDQEDLAVKLYQSKPESQVRLHSKALLNVDFIGPTQEVGICMVSLEMLDDMGADDNDVSGLVEKIRDIDRCKVSVVIHQVGQEEYKVSFRSCCDIDVSKIARAVGKGGGHVKAAGMTFLGSPVELREKLDAEFAKVF